jgi:hypothetical protein
MCNAVYASLNHNCVTELLLFNTRDKREREREREKTVQSESQTATMTYLLMELSSSRGAYRKPDQSNPYHPILSLSL